MFESAFHKNTLFCCWYAITEQHRLFAHGQTRGALVMGAIMSVVMTMLEVSVLRPMLRVEVLMPLFMGFVQLAVQAAMLPLRHRALMHGLMHIA
jgi:F0F1-type ATP synthase assembly protein I